MSKQSRQRRQDRPESTPAPAAQAKISLKKGGLHAVWQRVLDFSGASGGATFLWTRWLVLRAVGLVYVIVFAGIIHDQAALAAPGGLLPIADYLNHVRSASPGAMAAFFSVPSLFWLNAGDVMIHLVSLTGLVAAIALVFNLWPRGALAVCWVNFLAFIAAWPMFSAAQLDRLMLETAFLAWFFAPRGFRPRLGADSAPSTLVVFMMRWFLFRVMFESGLVKLTAGDPHWRNFSAMEVMYETSPFPTWFGYLDHHLPHWYHWFEILFTFTAELVAPLLALFAGRRGRWVAFFIWTVFQAGIQLTNNFGWLNVASIGLGFLLLDDQMLGAAATRLRLFPLAHRLSARAVPVSVAASPRWPGRTTAAVLWVHFALSVFYLAKSGGARVYDVSPALNAVVEAVRPFGSVNEYHLYARFEAVREQVEFVGSNDQGETWKPYAYRFAPQQEDEISPFIAPWFARFDASLEIAAWGAGPSALFPATAAQLLRPNPTVVALFRENPFPEAPPTLLRMRRYRLKFTSLATQRETGRYWDRELAGDYLPAMHVREDGRIVAQDLAAGEAELSRGNTAGAMAIFTRQYIQGYQAAGFRLADLYLRGPGRVPDPLRTFAIFQALAREGEPAGEYNVGLCYENGVGVAPDPEEAIRWYRRAATHGFRPAYFNLGALGARGGFHAIDDTEALAALLTAERLMGTADPTAALRQTRLPELVQKLKTRMTPTAIRKAHELSALVP